MTFLLRASIVGHSVVGAMDSLWAQRDPQALEKINLFAPKPIDLEQIHVRTFLAANSRPSKDNVLRIREKAINKFAKLYPGAPVLRNHGTSFLGMIGDDMPIGTVFDGSARTAEDKSRELVLPFYLARNDEIGDRAAKYIDLGIWKESSIHGMFSIFECSICGKSFGGKDACSEHEPGQEYEKKQCLIELDDPTEAPEFSLCWSGRLAGTKALSQPVLGMPEALTLSQLMERRDGWLQKVLGRKQEKRERSWLSGVLEYKPSENGVLA